jgi:hypothetical protein
MPKYDLKKPVSEFASKFNLRRCVMMIAQKEDMKKEMIIANGLMCGAIGALCIRAHQKK